MGRCIDQKVFRTVNEVPCIKLLGRYLQIGTNRERSSTLSNLPWYHETFMDSFGISTLKFYKTEPKNFHSTNHRKKTSVINIRMSPFNQNLDNYVRELTR